MPGPALLGLPLATGGGAALVSALGLGGLFGASQLFGKKKQDEEDIFQNYMPPMSPEQQQLYDWGYGQLTGPMPEFDQQATQQWGDIQRQIAELYQGRRQLGVGSTPEVAALGRSGAELTANTAVAKSQARQNLYNMLRGLVRQPITGIQQPQPSGLENLLSFAAPLASGYMQQQALMPLWRSLLGGNTAKNIAPDPIVDIFKGQGGPLTYDFGKQRGLY